MYQEIRQDAQDLLEEQVRRAEETGVVVAGKYLRVGRPDEEIIGLSDELDSHLIVMGDKGTGPLRRLLGNVTDSVVRHANCPVLVVRSTKEARGRTQG